MPPTVHKGSLFSTSSLTLVISWLFDDSHSYRCEEISYCGFVFLIIFVCLFYVCFFLVCFLFLFLLFVFWGFFGSLVFCFLCFFLLFFYFLFCFAFVVVLIFISLMISDVKHLFMYVLVGYLYVIFGKMSVQFLCPLFLLDCLGFLLLSFMSSLCILDINP